MYWKIGASRVVALGFVLVLLLISALGSPPLRAAQTTNTLPPLQLAPRGGALYASFARSGRLGHVDFDPSDIMVYYQGKWSLYFDGSDVGLKGQNLNAFELLADGSILMAFTPRTLTLPEIRQVTHNDVIRFVPVNLGTHTRGRFERFIKGLDIGLSVETEAIDALALDADGRLVISTDARFNVPGETEALVGRGHDLLVFNPGPSGSLRDGYWQVYVRGAELELTVGGENTNALWIDPADSSLYLGTRNRFTAGHLSGTGRDIFIARPSQPADFVEWDYQPFFNGGTHELKSNLGGVSRAVYPHGPISPRYEPRRR